MNDTPLNKAETLKMRVASLQSERARADAEAQNRYVDYLEAKARWEEALFAAESLETDFQVRRLAGDALNDGVKPSWVVKVTGLSRSTVYRLAKEMER